MLYLVFDIVNKVPVSYNGSSLTIPGLFQTNILDLQIQFVQPSPGSVIPYTAVDVGTMLPRMTIASKVTGVEANEPNYVLAQAIEAAFTWDGVNLWFTGTINLDTTEMATYLGSSANQPAVVEFDLTTGGVDPETMYQGAVTVYANADTGGPASTTPVNGSGGTLALQNGVGGVTIAGTVVTVAGLNWGTIPNSIVVSMNVPAGKNGIFGWYISATATVNGFQFGLSGPPDDNTYTFTYFPVF